MEDAPAEQEVSLSEYVSRLKELIDIFAREHVEGYEREPEAWPLRMRLGDWDQQLFVFLTTSADSAEED